MAKQIFFNVAKMQQWWQRPKPIKLMQIHGIDPKMKDQNLIGHVYPDYPNTVEGWPVIREGWHSSRDEWQVITHCPEDVVGLYYPHIFDGDGHDFSLTWYMANGLTLDEAQTAKCGW